jgi:hypothetical protein
MKNKLLLNLFFYSMLLTMFSSCEIVTGIFKAGMGFGIFLVVAIVGVIIYFVTRSGGNKG